MESTSAEHSPLTMANVFLLSSLHLSFFFKYKSHFFSHFFVSIEGTFSSFSSGSGGFSGFAETPLGRKRYFKPVDSFSAQKSLERKGRNTPIQATCGDILKTAVRNLMKYAELKIINLVHDEIVFEVSEELASMETVEKIRDAMVRAGEEFLRTVPVDVDITVDTAWRK